MTKNNSKLWQLFACTAIIIVLTILGIGSVFAAQVSYLNFNENTGNTAYDQIGVNNLSIGGGTWTAGKYSYGLSLIVANATFSSTTGWTTQTPTAEMWVYLNANSGTLFNSGSTLIQYSGSNLNCYFYDGTYHSATFTSTVPLSSWHHITCTYNGTAITAYLDGIYNGSTNIALTLNPSTQGWLGWDHGTSRMDGVVDEFKFWNTARTSAQIQQDMQLSNSVTLTTPSSGNILVHQNQQFNASYVAFDGAMINATYYIYNWTTLYNKTTIPVTGTTNSTSLFINLQSYGNYTWNSYLCTAVSCTFGTNSTFTITNYVQNSVGYSPAVLGGIDLHTLNITYDSSIYPNILTLLNYNGTTNAGVNSGSGDNGYFSYTQSIPTSNAYSNFSFYWEIFLTNGTGTLNINTTTYSQQVTPISMDNCSGNNATLMNLVMVDEDNLTAIPGTIEAAVSLYAPNGGLISIYNATRTYDAVNPVRICVSSITSNVTLAYTLKYYGSTSYYQQYKTVQSMVVNNQTTPQNITLYDLLTTSGYPFQVTIAGILGVSNLLVDTQRQYLSTNNFLSVESSATDSNGVVTSHLVQNSVVYNFVVSQGGVVLATFNNYHVKCDNPSIGTCSIILNIQLPTVGVPDFLNYGNIQFTSLSNNNTNTVYTTFRTTDGLVHNITQVVINNDGYSNTTICTSSVVSNSGTVSCVVPSTYGQNSVVMNIYSDGVFVATQILNPFSSGVDSGSWYGVRTIIYILLFSSLVFLFMSNPVLNIAGAMVGMALIAVLTFVTGGVPAGVIFWFIALGVVLFIRIARRT